MRTTRRSSAGSARTRARAGPRTEAPMLTDGRHTGAVTLIVDLRGHGNTGQRRWLHRCSAARITIASAR